MEPLNIVLGTDGSPESEACIQFLRLLPFPEGSAVHAVCVVSAYLSVDGEIAWKGLDEVLEAERERAGWVADEAGQALRKPGLAVTTNVLNGNPAGEILRSAGARGANLVAIGSKGLTGLDGFLLGSVARTVAKRAPCPVLVGRGPRNDLRAVVVATDGSEHADKAVEFARWFPLPEQAALTVCHVSRPYRLFPAVKASPRESLEEALSAIGRKRRETGERLVADAARRLEELGRSAQAEVCTGDPAREILRLAEERNADLIVVGAQGVSAVEGLLVGSVADHVLRDAPCAVLVVR